MFLKHKAPIAAARAAAEALGIRNGPTYTQIRVGADGLPRGRAGCAARRRSRRRALRGGDGRSTLNDLALDFALGRGPCVSETQGLLALPGGACVLFLVAPEGVLRAVEGREEAHAVEGVLDVRIYREPGHVFGPLRHGADRAGAVIAVGDSRDDALERARRAADAIRFLVA